MTSMEIGSLIVVVAAALAIVWGQFGDEE